METLIMIIANLTVDSTAVVQTKEQIISYLGERMIKDKLESFPHIILNSEVSEFDKGVIVEIADKKDLSVFFVEDTSVNFVSNPITLIRKI